MDDDDHYGENYLLDNVLHLKSIDADIFGSPRKYVKFEEEEGVYRSDREELVLTLMDPKYYGKTIDGKKFWLTGNTIGGSRKLFSKEHYPANIFGAADTAFTEVIKDKIDFFVFLVKYDQ